MPIELDSQQAEKLGQVLIQLLDLNVKPDGKIYTSYGFKIPIGLGRTVLRVVEETVVELADTRQQREPFNPNEPPFRRP